MTTTKETVKERLAREARERATKVRLETAFCNHVLFHDPHTAEEFLATMLHDGFVAQRFVGKCSRCGKE
jgi:hypothetical protein